MCQSPFKIDIINFECTLTSLGSQLPIYNNTSNNFNATYDYTNTNTNNITTNTNNIISNNKSPFNSNMNTINETPENTIGALIDY